MTAVADPRTAQRRTASQARDAPLERRPAHVRRPALRRGRSRSSRSTGRSSSPRTTTRRSAHYPPSLTPGRELPRQHRPALQHRRGQRRLLDGADQLGDRRRRRRPSRSSSSARWPASPSPSCSFRGSKVLLLVVIATMIVPVQLGVIPLYIEMNAPRLDRPPAGGDRAVPGHAFGVFLMRQYIVGAVPNELIEAARVDGCHTSGSSGTSCCPRSARPRPCSGCSRS